MRKYVLMGLFLLFLAAGCKEMQVQQNKLNTEGKPTVAIEDVLTKIGDVIKSTAPAIPIPVAGAAGTALGALLLFIGHSLGNYARGKAQVGTVPATMSAISDLITAKTDVQTQILDIVKAIPAHSTSELVPKLQAIFDSANTKADAAQSVLNLLSKYVKV